MATKPRNGKFVKVKDNLYRYTATKKYYAVFRRQGKLRFKSLKTSDREFAERSLKAEIHKIDKVDVRQESLTLEGLITLYEEQIKKYDAGTQENRVYLIKTFRTTWKHGLSIQVKDISPAQLDVWLAPHQSRLKRASINAYIIFLRQLFALAVSARAIGESPAAHLKMLKPETPIRHTPNWQQFQNIVESIRSQKLNDDAHASAEVVEFMGLAGVGMAECAHLKGEHLDFDAKKIWLYRHKTDTGYSIPMFPQVLPFLEKLRHDGRIKHGQEVFGVKDPKKALTNACKRLEYLKFSTRSLRRCFITRCVELGIDFKTIAAWQGHQDGGALIAKTYSHLRNEHSDRMAEKLVAA